MDATAAMSPEQMQDVKATTESVPKPANALTPPTSEEMNVDENKKEHEDSELSDLDLDDDDEEIEPDHYWDGGKIPVFKPTMEQFKSFEKFCEKIDKYGMKSGIVKVIPPKEWRDNQPALTEHVKRIKIKNPITQEFNGAFGTYTQQNVEKQRSYNLPEWKALTEETQHQPPAKRGERRRNQAEVVRGGGKLRGRGSNAGVEQRNDSPKPKKKPGRPSRRSTRNAEPADSGDEAAQVPPTPDTPATKPTKTKAAPKKGGKAARGGQTKSVTSRRLNNTAESADYVDEAAFKNFDYRMDGLDEFTPERCAELETHYWKSLAFNQPIYAADMPGSLFDDDEKTWNVAQLPNLLDVLGTKVPGVNTAYLYMGMWKATFAWHLEDVDLYSINYIHFGAPKHWYSISQEDARKFEAAMKQVWPMDAKNCDQFLRHKTYLISPDVLQKQYGVKVNKLVHYEGEFVMTYPYGYHSGFNLGYNCAESVNFATESWMEFGRIARKCNCEADNVWVDVSEIERKLRGEPTPEYYEETDDEDDSGDEEEGNLPSPPASVKGKAARGRKRKRDVKEEKPKKKKKIRIKIRAPTREPCVMCPNDNPWEALLPTDTGKNAHRSCALYTPETWIERDDEGNEKVCGVTGIDRARLELKCNFCRSKRGACFQCSSKKCTRAFHATCALAAGVQIDGGMVPTFGEDGTEYFEEGYDFRCKYHRPKMPKVVKVDEFESNKRIMNYAKELVANDVIQAQFVGGEVFAGLVVENRPGEMNVVVDVVPEGERIEVDWAWLCLLDPDDSQRPKPSATALPMPEGMNKKNVSVNNRQDGVPTQDEPFHDNPEYKWHDFYNMHTPPPGFTTKQLQTVGKLDVKIDAPDTLYFYLGEMSTEAKCFFTDKAGSNQVAPKANFGDRTQPPRPVQQYAAPRQHHFASMPSKQAIFRAQPQPVPAAISNPQQNRSEKPYAYKPKEPTLPNNMWAVDKAALAGQAAFMNDAVRRASQQLPQPNQPKPQYNYQGSDPARHAAPLRPFPREQYYSTATLPAAYPGEYSGFTQVARRQSQSSQSTHRLSEPGDGYVPNYQSVSQQRQQLKQGAPTVPAMGMGSSMPPNPYASGSSRPSSASVTSNQSPLGAPLTPATSVSSAAKTPESAAFLESLQKYPYLKSCYMQAEKPSQYVSPYSIGGGFSERYQPTRIDEQPNDSKHRATHTPNASISGQQTNQQWTPPSQIWHANGFDSKHMSPPLAAQHHQHQMPQQVLPPPRQYPQPTYQTPHEFRQSFQAQPSMSTASREGAQARLLRDQGYGFGPYAPHGYMPQTQVHRNSFGGQAYDTAKLWDSPKAPTVSPLSNQTTPGSAGYGSRAPVNGWNTLPRPAGMGAAPPPVPMMQEQTNDGHQYGPMLPQMQGGSETWRYN